MIGLQIALETDSCPYIHENIGLIKNQTAFLLPVYFFLSRFAFVLLF